MLKGVNWIIGIPVALAAATAWGQVQPQEGGRREQIENRQNETRIRNSQQQNQNTVQDRAGQSHKQGRQSLESHVADCLILGNQEEIAVLKLAMEQSQNREIKQLAQNMIQDHEQFIQKLGQFSSKRPSELTAGLSGDGVSRTSGFRGPSAGQADSATPQNPNAQNSAREQNPADRNRERLSENDAGDTGRAAQTSGNGVLNQIYDLERDAAQECVKLTKEALQKEQGQEFDKAFLGQQAGAHIGMLAKLKAAEDAVSGEFQQVVREGQKTTMEHKKQVMQLKEQIASSSNQTPQDSNRNR